MYISHSQFIVSVGKMFLVLSIMSCLLCVVNVVASVIRRNVILIVKNYLPSKYLLTYLQLNSIILLIVMLHCMQTRIVFYCFDVCISLFIYIERQASRKRIFIHNPQLQRPHSANFLQDQRGKLR